MVRYFRMFASLIFAVEVQKAFVTVLRYRIKQMH